MLEFYQFFKCLITGNGGWSSWTAWFACSATCGSATQTRYRYCNSPTPSPEGRHCEGVTNEIKACTLEPCPGLILRCSYETIMQPTVNRMHRK